MAVKIIDKLKEVYIELTDERLFAKRLIKIHRTLGRLEE